VWVARWPCPARIRSSACGSACNGSLPHVSSPGFPRRPAQGWGSRAVGIAMDQTDSRPLLPPREEVPVHRGAGSAIAAAHALSRRRRGAHRFAPPATSPPPAHPRLGPRARPTVRPRPGKSGSSSIDGS
jgi:hypothetical protein